MNKCVILVERIKLNKNLYCILRSSADQMLLKIGKHMQCACGYPPVHILSPVHLHLSGDLSSSADDADPLRVDPGPENGRLKHFRAVKLLMKIQVQYDFAFIKEFLSTS